ncbi:MAG: 2-oxo acid dehydrogenase subunit E2 [Deltaproteobacteria bacterium]|nr:2-oxo acid dehydrogenase subunit E2 [Deltaproteobacteria bacterium]
MATEVVIPNLGYTMTVAKILGWKKSVGDPIEFEEPLLEIETDKVNYLIEAPESGVVKALLANVGDEIPVGGIVAIIAAADEEVDVSLSEKKEPIPEGPPVEEPKEAVFTNSGRRTRERVLVSPVAKKMAMEKGIDLSLIKGTGNSGRIRKDDVERYLAEMKAPEPVEVVSPAMHDEVQDTIPMTSMRKTIARRLSQSFRDIPHINLVTEVDMTEAIRLRELTKERLEAKHGIRLSLNDIFIKTVADTICDHPLLNARLQGDEIEVLSDINIGLAVALENGLIVPALEQADRKRLWQIAGERRDLVERARQGSLSLHELGRGTFTISNLGTYEIVSFTSIINPPQSGILSIAKTIDRPVVKNGKVVILPIVEISLAVDHRIVDGAVAARFLQQLKEALEDPYLLI